jgi:hypothetical protein
MMSSASGTNLPHDLIGTFHILRAEEDVHMLCGRIRLTEVVRSGTADHESREGEQDRRDMWSYDVLLRACDTTQVLR